MSPKSTVSLSTRKCDSCLWGFNKIGMKYTQFTKLWFLLEIRLVGKELMSCIWKDNGVYDAVLEKYTWV